VCGGQEREWIKEIGTIMWRRKGGEKRYDAPHFFLSLYIVKSWTKYCERGCRPIGYV